MTWCLICLLLMEMEFDFDNFDQFEKKPMCMHVSKKWSIGNSTVHSLIFLELQKSLFKISSFYYNVFWIS